MSIYKRSGDTFIKLANPSTLPSGKVYGVAFSPDSNYLALTNDTTPYLYIYKRSGDIFTKLVNPSSLPVGTTNVRYGSSIAFSPDGVYLVASTTASPYLVIYKRSGDTFTKLANPSEVPSWGINAVAFSPDGNYLALGLEVNPGFYMYKRSGDTFNRIVTPSTSMPTTSTYGVAFSPLGYFAFAARGGDMYMYKQEGDMFIRIATIETPTLPSGNYTSSVEFSKDGKHLFTSASAGMPICIYDAIEITEAYLSRNKSPKDLQEVALTPLSFGYAKAEAAEDDELAVDIVFQLPK